MQPTYEDLKHNVGGSSLPRFSGLQPTYEDLKLGRPWTPCPKTASLQPTYEDLKHEGTQGLRDYLNSVCSLPTRI